MWLDRIKRWLSKLRVNVDQHNGVYISLERGIFIMEGNIHTRFFVLVESK